MNAILTSFLYALLLVPATTGYSQGTFQNLDFEAATNLPPFDPNNPWVPATNALPYWEVYYGGVSNAWVAYDNISLGLPCVSIQDANGYTPVLQGRYTVMLQPGLNNPVSAAIGQVGLVPGTSQSVRFFGHGMFNVSFDGQPIPLVSLGGTPTYTIFGGDISAFQGQSGELLFQGGGSLDNIFFSSQQIPEPSTFALSSLGACGATVFAFNRRRRRN